MKKDNIFSIVTMGCGLLLIISVFLPYITYYSSSSSLWKMEDSSRIIYILLGLLVIALYLINKKTELSYLAAGYGAFTTIGNIISLEGFDGLSIGFYLILLSSITIGILTFLYDEEKADALINLSVSVNKPVMNNGMMMNNQQMNNVMTNPQLNDNMQNNNQIMNNQQQTQVEQKITGYDPMTGQPIYSNQNNN